MRLTLVFVIAASVVSASVHRRMSPNLPADAFPTFKLVPLEDAKEGKDLLDWPEGNVTHAVVHEEGAMRVANVQTAAAAACAANPNIRYEWRNTPTADRIAFISAVKCLMGKPPSGNFPPATNRYEDLVRLHQKYMPNVHGNANFVIWHRYYLWTFEQVLRKECGYTRPMIWWDEAKDAGSFHTSDMFTDARYFGHMTSYPDGSPVCIGSGAFSGLTCHIGPGQSNTPHCLSRAINGQLTSQCNQGYVDLCNSRTDYNSMASCSETGPHAYGHNGIGGVMSDVSASPSDPVFWMHHSFIDHSYRIWQNADSSRIQNINGVDVNGNPLSLDYEIAVGGIMPNVKLGDIINTLGGVVIGGVPFCYRYNY